VPALLLPPDEVKVMKKTVLNIQVEGNQDNQAISLGPVNRY